MKRRYFGLIVSGLMVLSLVLGSCGPAAPSGGEVEETGGGVVTGEVTTPEAGEGPAEEVVVEEEVPEMVTIRLTKHDGTVVTKQEEKPQYGGTIVRLHDNATIGFDDIHSRQYSALANMAVNEELLTGDITRGPRGTNETAWNYSGITQWINEIPMVAESWETPDKDTFIINIRPGIRFHNKPPTNGRELTAEDVAYTVNRAFTVPTSYVARNYSTWFKSAEATDKYTVVVKGEDTPTIRTGTAAIYLLDMMSIFPKDALEEFGDFGDWRNLIGSGPWMLVDYVPGSSATFDKNPNYWRNDPWFLPDNEFKLPYADHMKLLIVLDKATRLAAIRTGRADWVYKIKYEDANSLIRTNPEWNYFKALAYWAESAVVMRVNDPNLPTYDKRVRRALNMAVDQQAIADSYYGGDAEIHSYPAPPDLPTLHTPFNELPQEVQDNFGYDPEGAKQLLAEAGYPNGFKAKILTQAAHAELLQVVQAYWAAIDVEAELDVKEPAVMTSITRANQHEDMVSTTLSLGTVYKMWSHLCVDGVPGSLNNANICDDYMHERFAGIFDWENLTKPEIRDQLTKENAVRILENVTELILPRQYEYIFWTPWIKGYGGAWATGYHNRIAFTAHMWVDQDLKEEMGY
jgi:peptide/nickel transport system substrate-binding protein